MLPKPQPNEARELLGLRGRALGCFWLFDAVLLVLMASY